MINTMRFSGVTVAMAVAAAAWLSGPAAAQTSNAESLQRAMQKCAAIADAEARHICSDAVLEGAGMLDPDDPRANGAESGTMGAARSESSQPAAEAGAPEQAAQPPSGGETARSRRPADLSPDEKKDFFPQKKSRQERDEEVNQIEVTLQAVRELGSGKFLLTDSDGVVWQQLYTRATHIPPKAGQSMTVRKNALDGFMCRVEKTPSFRCKPAS